MYRYIKSAQATASLAKKLSAGWRQAYTEDVKTNRYQETLWTKHHDLKNKFVYELQTLLNKYVTSEIATMQVRQVNADIYTSEVKVDIHYKVSGSDRKYSVTYFMPSNNFSTTSYDLGRLVETALPVELENVLTHLTKTPYLKNLCDEYTEDLVESYNSWAEVFDKSYGLASYEFFVENIVGSGLFIPQPGRHVYYKPLRVAKSDHIIICEKCYYDNGSLVAKKVNKEYDTLVNYVSPAFTLLTERQVVNLEKSYTF